MPDWCADDAERIRSGNPLGFRLAPALKAELDLPVSALFMARPSSENTRKEVSMKLRDNGLGFSPVTIALHWIVAALLLSIIGFDIAISQTAGEVQRAGLTRIQNLLGTILFVISIYRFGARMFSYHPLPVGTPNPIEVIVSRSVAVSLALAMVLLPIAAWLSKSAAGEGIGLPGGFAIPALIEPNAQVKRVVDILFNVGATAFLLGLALHIFGALKNHLVLRNDALKRMIGKHVEL
jgi:cytochrome b561